MKREFHAQYAFALQDSTTQTFALNWLVDKFPRAPRHWPEVRGIDSETDDFARLMVLAQAIATGYKDRVRVGRGKDPSGGLYYWIRYKSERWLRERLNFIRNVLELETNSPLFPSLPNPSLFPPGSWAVQVHFTLRKPYISKDDVAFYILDNPVKKEWVFKVPYVAPSQWKGALRATMIRRLVEELALGKINENGFVQKRLQQYRLFGNEKDGTAHFLNRALALHRVGPHPDDEHEAKQWERQTLDQVAREFEERVRTEGYRNENVEGFQGRLHFYPTFFDRIGLEVINPHDRKTGAGTKPIYFECVPAGTPGVFTLLYVPLDQVGKGSPEEIEQEAQADLAAVARGVRAMLTEYGFGAKTSSGYGVADVIKEQSTIRAQGFSDADKVFWKAWNGKG